MRLLHTSDWHLGQHFMGKSRQAEHQALIDWLLLQVDAQAVDAVLIAGDLFDTGTPPSYARELYNQLVLRLHEAGVGLLLLAGNHDSVAVLAESCDLLARLGTRVVATAGEPADAVHVLSQRNGQPGCLACAIPFIRPRDVLSSQPGQSADDKQQALQQAITRHYAAVYAAARAKKETLGLALPIIATGHLTTVGAKSSESVREIYVGSLDALPSHSFPPADYIALGHIHRPQTVGGQVHIRYSGSPLALSFDEARQEKEMLLVDLDDSGLRTVNRLPVPCFQALVGIDSNLADLPAAIGAAAAAGTVDRPAWLEITIAEDDYLADLPARVQAMCDGWPVDVLRIRKARGQRAAQLANERLETLAELTPDEVFARRLAQENLSDDMQHALMERYQRVVSQLTAPTSGEAL
ncbi:MAG: exonuclease subunit SbcD [Dechloromonas sp.]|nr:exonuclease subunit SbcD [Dechloromonas sp.]